MGILYLLCIAAPTVCIGAVRCIGRPVPSGLLRRAANYGSVFSLLGAALAIAITSLRVGEAAEPLPILGIPVTIAGVYFDRLSGVMLCVISIIGAVVLRYSIRYLDGDPRRDRFMWFLALTISAVQLLVVASNLAMFFFAWLAVSLSLHQLLNFYPQRSGAVACARKKFLISRIGDIALVLGSSLTYFVFGTLDFAALFRLLTATPTLTGSFEGQLIAILFAIGALTKSAQLPFHSWLPDSLETPTPVSALMHAGIINAGGFLLIRLSPLFQDASMASTLLSMIGAATALYGMSVMVTQPTIKRRLAYSTVGQMGFMIMQCGLGLYHLALLHIVAHAFYKAYAFLRAGSAMDQARQQSFFHRYREISLAVGGCIGVALLAGFVCLLPYAVDQVGLQVAHFPLLVVWMLASLHLFIGAASASERRLQSLAVAAAMVGGMACMYVMLSTAFFAYIGSTVAGHIEVGWGIALTLVAIFTAGFVLHISMQAFGHTSTGRKFFIHLSNGFYLGVLFDHLTARVWSAGRLNLIK